MPTVIMKGTITLYFAVGPTMTAAATVQAEQLGADWTCVVTAQLESHVYEGGFRISSDSGRQATELEAGLQRTIETWPDPWALALSAKVLLRKVSE